MVSLSKSSEIMCVNFHRVSGNQFLFFDLVKIVKDKLSNLHLNPIPEIETKIKKSTLEPKK